MVGFGIIMMATGIYGEYGIAGALTAANTLAWAIGTAVLSNLVDRYGQRKIMLPGALISAASLAMVVVLAIIKAPLVYLFIFAILTGLFQGSPGAMVRARWNNVLSSAKDLHTAYSLESTLDELGFIAGPVLVAWLAVSIHPVAGLVGPIIFIAGGASLFYSLRATQPRVIPRRQETSADNRFIALYEGFIPVLGVGFLFGGIFGSLDVSVVAVMTEWDVRENAGLILAVFSLGSALGGFLYGTRGWVSPLRKRYLVAVSLMAATIWTLIFATNPWMLAAFGVLIGFAVAPTFINANGLIGYLVPPSRLTEGLAWLGTAIGIGVSIGSAVSGVLIDHGSYTAGFMYSTISGLLALIVATASAPQLESLTASTRQG
jgi:MFS family permease